MANGYTIAIDGPVASGKGTIVKELSRQLNGYYLNTGAMYRAVALYCIDNKVNIDDEGQVVAVLPKVNIQFIGDSVFINGKDVTERLLDVDVSKGSSIVATYPKIREDLVKRQQEIADVQIENGQIVIAEGRDIGTKVLPNAKLKVFLTASIEARARRRFAQYSKQGKKEELEKVQAEIKERDERDMNRSTDPLPANPENLGYFVLDNSRLSEGETIRAIMGELNRI